MWEPLRQPVFRAVWLAAFVGNIGTWMQTVGGQWLLIETHSSNLLISLVQSAASIPVLLLVLPAGVLADFLDRRRLLIVVQGVLAVTAGLLALLTSMGRTTPEMLLLFTFLLGCGAAAQLPAFQSFISDLLPRQQRGQGAALSSLSVNLARAVGPAIAGLLVAHIGVTWLFALDAVSFLLFGAALLATKTGQPVAASPRVISWPALQGGVRYVVHAPVIRRVLLRLVMFVVPANVLWALLAPLARGRLGLNAAGYGILLGAAGVGAVLGAVLLPTIGRRLSPTRQLGLAGLVFGAGLVGLAFAVNVGQAIGILVVIGVAWIAVIVGLNAATQAFLPDWVRARALAVYQMVLFGTFAGSAAFWGALATWVGISRTFAVAGVLLVVVTVVGRWFPLWESNIGDRAAIPVTDEGDLDEVGAETDGPLDVVVEYHVAAADEDDFLHAIGVLRTSRLRTGAVHWSLLRDSTDRGRLFERYQLPSPSELRDLRLTRVTPFDKTAEERVAALAEAVIPARHLLIVDVPRPRHHEPRKAADNQVPSSTVRSRSIASSTDASNPVPQSPISSPVKESR